MAGRKSITILHLSDVQFGRNHRFGRLALPPPDDQFDSLFARLRDDLDLLRAEQGLVPELVILSGDIAEWGKRSEFDDALELLDRLAKHLDLPRRRIGVIPGNHDINRGACLGYFTTCESDERKPVPPYWPKWTQYKAFFDQLYKDAPEFTFTPDQPWTLFRIDDLKIVIAGVNSTIVESHLDDTHYGYAGETQYRWFADQLKSLQREGWLRIGVVHHNVLREAADAEENLRDADLLKRWLAPALNLCLHGHTHEANLNWLDQHVPVLSTGSAAVVDDALTPGVPNQYQILRLSAGGLDRFTRFLDLRKKQWMADPRGSSSGNEWITHFNISFTEVFGTFPEEEAVPSSRDKRDPERERESSLDLVRRGRRDDFLSRVAEVCQHRNPNATVTEVPASESSPAYLRVVERNEGFVRTYPIGVFEKGLTADLLKSFSAKIDAQYRASDPTLKTEIVYGGTALAAPNVCRLAERSGIHVRSFIEYQGITDFRAYVRRQTDALERDTIYPPSLYVPQRMHFIAGVQERDTDQALNEVHEWLASPDPRFVVILGDFGTGKTFLLHELARRLGGVAQGPTPILIDLRALEKARTVDTLIAQHLASAGIDRIDLAAFRYMLQQGRIVLLFDGFDELALRVSYERAAEHFDTIVQAMSGDAKVVVTSRTQHFESEKQVRTILYDRAQPVPGLRYCKLLAFEEPQIRQFLLNRWNDPAEAEEWIVLLHDVKDLLGLSENPRMLGFITELDKEDLRKAKAKAGGAISAAKLYQLLINRWLGFEYERAHPRGMDVTLTPEARWAAVTAIANRLWQKTERFLTQSELNEEVSIALRTHMESPPDASIASHLIGSGSLLRRDEEGAFFFVHQSVMEWLVARQAAGELRETGATSALRVAPMSALMAEFFCDLATPPASQAWAEALLAQASLEGSVLKVNALEVLARLGGGETRLNLAGQDLRGRDLTNLPLRGADLREANLTDQRLAGKDLTNAQLDGATLIRANMDGAILAGASLNIANLSQASLLGANLRGADIHGGIWHRSRLAGTQFDDGVLKNIATWGAARRDATDARVEVSSRSSPCLSIAFSPDGTVLATGHWDARIRLWDVQSGLEIRQLTGHSGYVRSMVFSYDGQWLASGSNDHTVRLWNPTSGQAICEFSGHSDSVTSVAFSHDGQWLASGGDDRTVRLWNPTSGQAIRKFSGHSAAVRSVAFSHDSQWLASGCGKNILLWNPESGQVIRKLSGHSSTVESVVFSHDGKWLASGGDDRTVRLWNPASGQEIRKFSGHSQSVLSVAFSHDGKWLASGGDDRTVRLWSPESGQKIREFSSHAASVESVAFNCDGHLLAGGSYDNTIRLWNPASGQEIRQFSGHSDSVWSVAFSRDGQWLASGGDDRTVRLWNPESGKETRKFSGHSDSVKSVAFSHDGQWLASGSLDQTVRLWNPKSGPETRKLLDNSDSVWSVAFSHDGQWLASGSGQNIFLWNPESGRKIRKFSGHSAPVFSVVFSHDGQWLASGSYDQTVRLWNTESGKEIRRFSGHSGSVWSVAFSHHGRWLASGSDDHTVRLWNTESGKEIRRFSGHSHSVLSVVFSHDGQWLASGSHDHTVRLWNPSSGQTIRQLSGHSASVRNVVFSHDNQWLASGGDDNTIRLWNVETGELRFTLFAAAEGWVAFSPDGRYKTLGNLAGGFWFALGLCRFEPGELDPYVPSIRAIPLDEPF